MTDPIADLLTRIRNAAAIKNDTVTVPHSNIKESIVNILKSEGYVANISLLDEDKPQKTLQISLMYKGKYPVISHIKRISKPGRRVYVKADDIKPSLSGYGFKIISTSQGILTDEQAKEKNIGGEVLCEIW